MSHDTRLSRFQTTRLLKQDQSGRRIILEGNIDNQPALLLAERGTFDTTPEYLQAFPQLLSNLRTLGDNDIYSWYVGNSSSIAPETKAVLPPDLKLNLISPCTPKHVAKYSFQQTRYVTETPHVYKTYVRPYMARCRAEGRLNWVWNILEGRAERENVLWRTWEATNADGDEVEVANDPSTPAAGATEKDFILLPDLNWDRADPRTLHLLALPARRDIWSIRDLRRDHLPWLRDLRTTVLNKILELYPGRLESDLLKFYFHYQPTYYHLHIHIVHVDVEPLATQGLGKALGLEVVMGWLNSMGGGGEGMSDVDLSYGIGEESELWKEIFLPIKEGRLSDGSS